MTAIPLANTVNTVGGQAPAQGQIGITSYIVILLQLGLLTLLLRQFQIESAAFLRLALLAFGGFAIHAVLPMRYRLPFFLGLSLIGIVLVLDIGNGLSIIGTGFPGTHAGLLLHAAECLFSTLSGGRLQGVPAQLLRR